MTFTNFTQVYFVPKPVERNAVWEHYYLDSGTFKSNPLDCHCHLLHEWILPLELYSPVFRISYGA